MSLTFRTFVHNLFGRKERSDCTILFYVCPDNPSAQHDSTRLEAGLARSDLSLCVSTPRDVLNCLLDYKPCQGATVLAEGPPASSQEGGSAQGADGVGGCTEKPQEPAYKRQKLNSDQDSCRPVKSVGVAELAIGEPFPAHTLVLCGGSPRFQAQVDRWTQGAQASGTKPVLRVPLGSAEELPHALATVQFMYTGTLGVCRASDLLQVWRMAAYLQVEGCQLECLAALRTLIFRNIYMLPWSTSAPMPPVLDGVSELYSNRHRIPDATVDPSFVRGLKDACRADLAAPQAYAGTAPAVSPGGPTVGELLAWAFEDAPTVLNDAGIRQQMWALPLAAIEALLSSASFATDDEATVVLMVAFWMVDKDQDDDTDERLSKLIRVAQLNATYLHRVLPHLSWFPIPRADYFFLCEYACATDAKKRALIEIKGLHPDCLPAWYALNPRPKPSRASYARGYEWAAPPPLVTGKSEAGVFECAGSCCVFLDGFGWQPLVELEPGSIAASVHLKCWRLPDTLQLDDELIQEELLVAPQDLRLAIFKWAGGCGSGQLGERQLAWSETFRGVDYIKLDGSICIEEALPLAAAGDGEQQQQQQQPADPLVAWRPYLRDGKLRGALTRCCAD